MANTGFDDRDVAGMFYASYEEQFNGSWARELSLYNPSSSAVEPYGILGANPVMREWIGPRQEAVFNKKTYEIRNRQYEATLAVKEMDLARDKTGLLHARIGTFASDAGAGHWEDLLISAINANGLTYDGKALFATDHEFGASGSQKNEITATEAPSANVSTATAPTPTEMANVILESAAYMMTLLNDKGRAINGQAKQFAVIVSTAQLFSATVQAIGNMTLAAGAVNPLAGLLQAGFSFKPYFIGGITSATDKVILARMDSPVKPFILQDEQGLQLDILGRGSDYYFDNKAIKMGVNASRGCGYGEPLTVVRCTLS